MKKYINTLLISLTVLLLFCSCNVKNEDTEKYSNYTDLNGEKIGIVVGTVFEQITMNVFDESKIVYYTTVSDSVAGIKEGKVEAVVTDYGIAIQACKQNDDLSFFSNELTKYDYAMVFPKTESSDGLRNAINEFLDNEYAGFDFNRCYRQWANEDEYESYDYKSLPNVNGVIKVATDGQSFPFVFMNNNQLTGIEVEILYNFCLKEGYALQIDTYDFNGVLAAVSSGHADIGASGLCYSEERAERFNFSNFFVSESPAILVRKDSVKLDFQKLSDLSNTTVCCISGTVYDVFLNDFADNVTFQYYDSLTDQISALMQGKASAGVINSKIFEGVKTEYNNLRIIDTIYVDNIGYIFPKSSEPTLLQLQLDEFIKSLRHSGELEKIWDMWDSDVDITVDYSSLQAKNGTIRFAVCSGMGIPNNYIKDGKYCGLDIDIMTRFAREYGYAIEFTDYSFSGVLAAVTAGKADVGGCNITISDERKKSMNFSEPYLTCYVYAITLDDSVVEEEKTFVEKFMESFEKTFITEKRYKLFLSGVKTTLLITFCSCALGTIFGFCLYMLFRNSNTICSKLFNIYSWIISGLPTVVLLMVFYYVIFVKTNLSAEIISVISFALLFSLAIFNILKTCFIAVDKGQYEAGYALGYSKFKTITNIIIPEIAPMFFPSYRVEITNLIKATSIVGYIAVQDLTKISDIIRSRTYEAFFPLIAIAVIYLLISLVLDIISRQIEKRINTRNRTIKEIMKGVKTK